MGIYLNPLTNDFTDLISEDVFVDQTEMLAVLAGMINKPTRKYVAVSRPRRFGKTVDANMIVAFFEKNGKLSQFDGLGISSHKEACTKHQGQYHVIKIDMSKGLNEHDTVKPYVQEISADILSELNVLFPDAGIEKEKRLYKALAKIYANPVIVEGKEKREQFVIVIDEWDAPLRLMKNDQKGQVYYIAWLNTLFKNQDYLALAYMTGILPIKKYGDDSLMNMFDEYSMTDPGIFAPYMGFTEEDVENLCKRNGKMIAPFKKWYDGYLLTTAIDEYDEETDDLVRIYNSLHVFNPKSVTKALSTSRLGDYWDQTGQFAALKDYIDTDLLGVRTSILEMMEGGRKEIDIGTYQNDIGRFACCDDVLTMLIHLGYLTYDAKTKEAFIPNHELKMEFAKAASPRISAKFGALSTILSDSVSLLEDTWNCDADKVAEAIEDSHMLVCAPLDYNNEMALSIAVDFAYYSARSCYTVFHEAPSGKGYADLMYIPVDPRNPAMVIELKWNKKVKTAIDQIRNKKYPARLQHYAGNILCVGISYEKTDSDDPQYKEHACVIEKM